MSLHRSLVTKSSMKRARNVLSRAERAKLLQDEGKWEEGRSVFGLPKVRVRRVKAGAKQKKAEKAVAEAAEKGAVAAAEGAEGEAKK